MAKHYGKYFRVQMDTGSGEWVDLIGGDQKVYALPSGYLSYIDYTQVAMSIFEYNAEYAVLPVNTHHFSIVIQAVEKPASIYIRALNGWLTWTELLGCKV